MANKKSETSQILGKLTELVLKHDKKLALDYQSIQRLEKDSDVVTKNVGALSETVHTMAGTVKTQSSMVNSILAITVLAFLSFMVTLVFDNEPKNNPAMFAETFVNVIREEVSRQIPMAQAESGVRHETSSETGTSKERE